MIYTFLSTHTEYIESHVVRYTRVYITSVLVSYLLLYELIGFGDNFKDKRD